MTCWLCYRSGLLCPISGMETIHAVGGVLIGAGTVGAAALDGRWGFAIFAGLLTIVIPAFVEWNWPDA